MTRYLFRNVQLLDPRKDRLVGAHEALVEGHAIREVSERPVPGGRRDGHRWRETDAHARPYRPPRA